MPFVSKAQMRACFAKNDPKWDCRAWLDKTDVKNLPEKKKKAKKFKEWLEQREKNGSKS